MRALASTACCLLLLACGGLDNDPLRHGDVAGRFAGEVDVERGWIAIFGSPETATTLRSDGTFRFTGLPAGAVEIIGVLRADASLRVSTEVRGGGVADLGVVAPRKPGHLKVKLSSKGEQRLSGGTVTVAGTPVRGVALDDDGDADIEALPPGCYDVEALVPGMGALQKQRSCLNDGQEVHAEFVLPTPDGTKGREGCVVTGCLGGLSCDDRVGECH